MAEYIPQANPYAGLAEETLRMRAQTQSPWAALANVAGQVVNQYGQQKLDERRAAAKLAGEKEIANIKGDASFNNTHTMATDEMIQKNPKLKQIGAQAGDWYPNRFFLPDAPKGGSGGGSSQYTPTPDEQKLINKAMEEKRLTADVMQSKRTNLQQIVQKLKDNPNFNFVESGAYGAGQKTEAAAKGRVSGDLGGKSTATGQTLDDVLDKMEPLISKAAPTGIRMVNKGVQAVKRGVNDQDATQLESYIQSARSLYAQQLQNQGAPQVQAKRDAEKAIPSGMDLKAFRAARAAIKFESSRRAQHLSEVNSGGVFVPTQAKSVDEHAAAIFGGGQ